MPTRKTLHAICTFADNHQTAIVHLCALFFLTTGLAYSFYLGDALRFRDERLYYAIATNLATGNGYTFDNICPTAIFPPAYPLFLALFIKLGASIELLRYLNFIALALCVYIIRSILNRDEAQSGTVLSSIYLIGYGVLFFIAGTLYTQTVFTLVLLLIVRLAVASHFGYSHGVLLGILSALIIMIHPTGIFIPPLVVLWLIFPANRAVIKKVVISALVAVACVAPWAYRNYTTFDRFIPFTSHGGDTLYIGNNPNTSLSSWYNYINEDYYIEASKLSELEQNRYYLRKTAQFWTEQTGDAVKLYLRKLVYHFNFRNDLHPSNNFGFTRSAIMFVTYYPMLICLVLRLAFAGKIPLTRTEKLLVAIYIASAFFHAIFLPRLRFRVPYDAVLITHIGIMFSLIGNRYGRQTGNNKIIEGK